MHFGINTFLFTSPFTNESVSYFPRFKEWGFDSVEIALEDASHIDPAVIKDHLEKNGLTCKTVCAAMSPDLDLRGTEEQQQAAFKYLTSLLDTMSVLGAEMLIGPLYSAVGRADAVPEDEYKQQWQTSVGHLKNIAAYAEKLGLKLGIEPLNRFETDFVNTVDQGLQMIKDIGNPAVFLHYDTFHMNIEEKDQEKAIRNAGKLLGHFHACGCDRGTPGNDHIDWNGIAKALKEVQYDGSVVIESFTKDVKVIARAAAIWRQIEPSQEAIAADGVKFLKKLFAE
ncbi:MAG: sugar phosphate isomerase/epimerase [Chitinophagaceae bacterium]